MENLNKNYLRFRYLTCGSTKSQKAMREKNWSSRAISFIKKLISHYSVSSAWPILWILGNLSMRQFEKRAVFVSVINY